MLFFSRLSIIFAFPSCEASGSDQATSSAKPKTPEHLENLKLAAVRLCSLERVGPTHVPWFHFQKFIWPSLCSFGFARPAKECRDRLAAFSRSGSLSRRSSLLCRTALPRHLFPSTHLIGASFRPAQIIARGSSRKLTEAVLLSQSILQHLRVSPVAFFERRRRLSDCRSLRSRKIFN